MTRGEEAGGVRVGSRGQGGLKLLALKVSFFSSFLCLVGCFSAFTGCLTQLGSLLKMETVIQ